MVTLAAVATGLSGCGDDGSSESSADDGASPASSAGSSPSSTASPSSSATPRPSGTSIDIKIKDGKVSPNGERVEVEVGKPVTLHIDADSPGEIHVHSTPEQEIPFDEGTSTERLTIGTPGIVDVEDHALEQVIVQLEVR
jgi:hypothetical protein